MRCKACDALLNAFEATRKSDKTQEYIDLCNKCLDTIDIEDTSERYDLEGIDEHYREKTGPNTGEDEDQM